MKFTLRTLDSPDEDGHRFHFVPVKGIPNFDASEAAFQEVLAWTIQEIGDGPSVNGLRQAIGSRWCYKATAWTIWMRDEADAFQFRIRWC